MPSGFPFFKGKLIFSVIVNGLNLQNVAHFTLETILNNFLKTLYNKDIIEYPFYMLADTRKINI